MYVFHLLYWCRIFRASCDDIKQMFPCSSGFRQRSVRYVCLFIPLSLCFSPSCNLGRGSVRVGRKISRQDKKEENQR